MGENTPLKEVIFNDRRYSKAKKTLAILFSIFVFYLQVSGTDKMIVFIVVFTVTALGFIHFVCKLIFYNAKRSIKDIILLIIFVGLLFWSIYTFSDL